MHHERYEYDVDTYIHPCWKCIFINWLVYLNWIVQFACTLAEEQGRRSIQLNGMQWRLHSVYVNPINIIRLRCVAQLAINFVWKTICICYLPVIAKRPHGPFARRWRGRGMDGMLQLVLLLLWQRATNLKAQFVHLCQLVTRSKIKRINKMCRGQALATRGCGQRA